VPGTRLFPSAPGHGDTPPAAGAYDHDLLGRGLEQVADAHGATQALGVSMGAGALLSLLARRPDRFARLVLLLPAALDRPRTGEVAARLQRLAGALDRRDEAAVAAHVAGELPADLHDAPGVPAYLAARTAFLLASAGVAAAVRGLPGSPPVADRVLLGAVTAKVLVVAQEHDPLHPAQVARELVAALPSARLVVLGGPGSVVRERRRLRALVREWLTP
jgi:pimeloyl-ACP methyl ester carboxylesterase